MARPPDGWYPWSAVVVAGLFGFVLGIVFGLVF